MTLCRSLIRKIKLGMKFREERSQTERKANISSKPLRCVKRRCQGPLTQVVRQADSSIQGDCGPHFRQKGRVTLHAPLRYTSIFTMHRLRA